MITHHIEDRLHGTTAALADAAAIYARASGCRECTYGDGNGRTVKVERIYTTAHDDQHRVAFDTVAYRLTANDTVIILPGLCHTSHATNDGEVQA